MAIAVQSTATGTFTTTSVVITKPSGLQVGDLLVACLCAEDGGAISTHSGWTELAEADGNANSSLQYIVATSTETAASNFTFTTASGDITGALLRIDGHAPTSLFSDSETQVDDNSSGGYDFGSLTVDPITDGELVIVVATASQCSAATSVSSPTINGTNPSWTEVLDESLDQGGGNFANGYVAYAIQAADTQITSFTATLTNTQAQTDNAGIVATVSPQTSVTGTFTHLSVSPTFFTPVATSGVNGTFTHLSVSPTINSPTAKAFNNGAISNVSKPSSTWINPDKP